MLEAFGHLTTERQVGLGIGPIPWSKMIDYAGRKGLDGDATELFVALLRVLDDGYLEHVNKSSG